MTAQNPGETQTRGSWHSRTALFQGSLWVLTSTLEAGWETREAPSGVKAWGRGLATAVKKKALPCLDSSYKHNKSSKPSGKGKPTPSSKTQRKIIASRKGQKKPSTPAEEQEKALGPRPYTSVIRWPLSPLLPHQSPTYSDTEERPCHLMEAMARTQLSVSRELAVSLLCGPPGGPWEHMWATLKTHKYSFNSTSLWLHAPKGRSDCVLTYTALPR